ncbi:hypothetical protein MKX03_037783 [Papaver bracteatum]|nr:hypothetical protein MKX03_037783 [Papaver bracteatum]
MYPYRNIRYWLGDYRRVSVATKEDKFNQAHARLRNVFENIRGIESKTQRDIIIACMSIHNFLRRNALDDWLFKQYENEAFEMNEIQVDEESETEENAPHLFGRQEQLHMRNLRYEIASLL